MKKKYLIDSFGFLYDIFLPHLGGQFDFVLMPKNVRANEPARKHVLRNFFEIRKLYRTGAIKDFGVVHFNRAEAFMQYRKIPGQVSVLEVHGFDVGVRGQEYLKDLHTPWKRIMGGIFDRLISGTVKRSLRKADIFYVSTPDLVAPIEAWCGRKPEWLPNAIDTETFSPEGPQKELRGSPACFLAARLHGDKRPEI